MKIYNKLVRDKIPDIIKSSGEIPEFIILGEKQFKYELKLKLREESREVISSSDEELPGELIDILEIIECICKTYNLNKNDLERLRQEKVFQRGSFTERIFLKSVS